MMFMNEWEVRVAVNRHAHHPVLSKASRFLAAFMDEVNAHSDGWAYWAAPIRAAKRLQELLQRGDATEAELRKAISPIKSFYTRRGRAAGMKWPEDTAA